MNTTVRRADVRDGAGLARLRWDFRPEHQAAQGWESFRSAFVVWITAALVSEWDAVVAEDEGGALVGCIFVRSVNKVPTPGAIHRAWGYVTNSYVAPSHRRTGVGARLLSAVIDVARERAFELLIVWPSREAVSFYARAGFQPVDVAHGDPGDHPPMELVLE